MVDVGKIDELIKQYKTKCAEFKSAAKAVETEERHNDSSSFINRLFAFESVVGDLQLLRWQAEKIYTADDYVPVYSLCPEPACEAGDDIPKGVVR
jgi:hypothetical protein